MAAGADTEEVRNAQPHAAVRPGYRDVLRDRAFQALSLANFVSVAGDQIARVAMSVLVYQRTASAALTGLTYAMSYLPSVLGGPLLLGVADRYPRRTVMIVCDLLRAAIVLLMAVPGMPLAALLVLLALVTLGEAPFDAARGALMPDVLPGERYPIGGAIGQVVLQAAMVLGFGLGGLLLLAATPRELLALDAATFAVSALLVRSVEAGRTRTPDADTGTDAGTGSKDTDAASPLADLRTAAGIVFGDRRLRPLVLLAWFMSAAAIAPEALAAPWAAELGAGSSAVGALLAAGPVGNVVGGLVLARLPESRRLLLLWPLAALAAAPLVLCLAHPSLAAAVVLVVVSGVGTAYHLVAMVRFVTLVAPAKRGRALGLAGSGLAAIQGGAVALAGAAADLVGAATTVGLAGVAGLLAACVWGPALRPTRPDPTASDLPADEPEPVAT
jgi:MFS family permease